MRQSTPEEVLVHLRPRFTGANIRTWIGFKTFMQLEEEAVLTWFRERRIGAQALFHTHGLQLQVVDSSAILPAVLETDDQVTAHVQLAGDNRFNVRLRVARNQEEPTVLRGNVTVSLVPSPDAPPRELPEALSRFVQPSHTAQEAMEVGPAGTSPETLQRAVQAGAVLWSWDARYFHCQYSDSVQHSAYVAAVEEVVDRFLEAKDLAIPRLLREKSWIPVVSRARVQSLAAAHMGEQIHSTFRVTGLLKRSAFEGEMDCYVLRGEHLLRVASAHIIHGYAVSRGPEAGRLAELDDATVAALTRSSRA
jgi:acyl-CoA thioesterase FadM